MKFRFPAIIFYTDKLPEKTGGCANAFIIRIREKYRSDEGIHQHELFHARNWFVSTIVSLIVIAALSFLFVPQPWTWATLPLCLFVDSALYLIPRFRQWEEIAAYKVQLQYPPALNNRGEYAPLYAGFISENYGLGISREDALEKLK